MQQPIIVKPSVSRYFHDFLEGERVLFLSAPCGFGKTSLARKLLRGKKVLSLTADDPAFSIPAADGSWDVLLLDDLQVIQDEEVWLSLCALIRGSAQRRFVLLSRGAPPGCMMAFQYAGLMTVLTRDDLFFDREDIRRLFDTMGVAVTDSELMGILKESIGYPLGVAITARLMAAGRPFSPELVTQAFREIFLYFETTVYQRFDLPIRRLLLELASFDSFDLEMARMVSGDPRAGDELDWLQRHTSMLIFDSTQRFRFLPQFRSFLLWEMDREYTEEKRRALFSRGGLYYELREDYPHALECYAKGGDHSKVSEILIRNAELHPGMAHYSEMETYYRSLPEPEVLASPSLMQGMCMLCALALDFDGSQRWYNALRDYAGRCGRQDAAGRQARSRLAWLDISLPQRGVEGMLETIPAIFRLLSSREITLNAFSVTSTLPSLMNGGKDFSPWSRRDEFLYKTMRKPVEAILGADGVGLADCAIAESKFEKGEDVSQQMLALISRMGDIQQRGTPDIEFAVGGLLFRTQLAAGQADDAVRTVRSLRNRFAEQSLTRFLPNMDALLCRASLHTGDLDAADQWYREKAPRDPMHLNVMKRFQYLTQALVELAAGQPDAALLTLSPLKPYFTLCARYIDGIHLNVICAIALYRKKDAGWQSYFREALSTAASFQFIRTISAYGGAILPLLEEIPWERGEKWFRRLLSDTRSQAAYYPLFLQPRLSPGETLTATETQILRLLCADKSNAEIGRIMGIKLATVKTHVSHILDKLGVSRRTEAKTAARKLWLIPEEL